MNGCPETTAGHPVSQRDIARHFGVSHVTVSFALRHMPHVSQELATRIRAYAEEVGYRRDPALCALAAYRDRKLVSPIRGVIGWIAAPSTTRAPKAQPEIEGFWRGANAAAGEKKLLIEQFRPGPGMGMERLHQILVARNISGLILPPHEAVDGWPGLPWEDFSVVILDRCVGGPRGHRVVPSATANMVLAIRQMQEKGYKRIGCVTGASLLRAAGYCMVESLPAVKRTLGMDIRILDAGELRPKRTAGAAIRSWIREHRLDAVLADDRATAALIRPGDAAVATLAGQGMAGIDLGSEEIGRTAVHMLDSLMQDRVRGIGGLFREVAVEGTWRDGASLPGKNGIEPVKSR